MLSLGLVLAGMTWSCFQPCASAAEMDRQGEAEAKEALRLYRQGRYEEAAKLFAKLSVDYPDMPVFAFNVGACFYYLRKPEPALSNLRHYLGRKKDLAPEEKASVERWIEEMEQLRTQNAAPLPPAFPPAPSAPAAPTSAPSLPSAEALPAPPPSPVAVPPPAVVPFPAPLPAAASPPLPTFGEGPPAAVALTSLPPAADSTTADAPFYSRWWFWTAVGVVVAASVTTYVIATRATENACQGGSIPCDAIK